MASYPADLMLVMLGFNDLGWFYSDDNGLLNNMATLIRNTRRISKAYQSYKYVEAGIDTS